MHKYLVILISLFMIVSCDNDDNGSPEISKPDKEQKDKEDQEEPEEGEDSNLVPCDNGMAGIYPCKGYDLLGQIGLSVFDGRSANDIWGWTDTTTGKEYALMGLNNGTVFIDISDADNLKYLGKLPTVSTTDTWRDIKVYKDHAFIVADNRFSIETHGMQVFDLTRLREATGSPQTFDSDAIYTGFGKAHNIFINEDSGFAYVVGTNRGDAFRGGAHFIDIRDPKNPIGAGGYADNGYSHDAQVVTYNGPDSAYSGREIYIGANEDLVIIADVTDKDNPVEIATVQYPNIEYTHQGWFTEDQRYFLLGDEKDEFELGFKSRTLIFDLTDLDNPELFHTYLGSTSAIDHNGYVKGDEFFLANYTAGIRVLDIAEIGNKNVSEIAFFDTYPANDTAGFTGVWSVYPYFESGKIIVSDTRSGLFVIKKSN